MKQTEVKVQFLTASVMIIAALVALGFTWLAISADMKGLFLAPILEVATIAFALKGYRMWRRDVAVHGSSSASMGWIVVSRVCVIAGIWGAFVLNNALIEATSH